MKINNTQAHGETYVNQQTTIQKTKNENQKYLIFLKFKNKYTSYPDLIEEINNFIKKSKYSQNNSPTFEVKVNKLMNINPIYSNHYSNFHLSGPLFINTSIINSILLIKIWKY